MSTKIRMWLRRKDVIVRVGQTAAYQSPRGYLYNVQGQRLRRASGAKFQRVA